jgi:hypothetical protein
VPLAEWAGVLRPACLICAGYEETGVLMRHIGRVLLVGIDRSHCVEIIEDCDGVGTSRIQTGDHRAIDDHA